MFDCILQMGLQTELLLMTIFINHGTPDVFTSLQSLIDQKQAKSAYSHQNYQVYELISIKTAR